MKNAWKIILIILLCLVGLGTVYFYRIGLAEDNSNVIIVKRIIDPSKSNNQDDTKINQLLGNITTDLKSLQNSKDSQYLNEIITDLKDF